MELRKVKKSELPDIKKILLEKQGYRCPITGRCLRSMKPINLCCDHNHQTGVIRAILPRGVNGLEGKMLALLNRFGGYTNNDVAGMATCLRGLADYLLHHRVPQTEWIYPTHQTQEEKRAQRNAQARLRYAKSKEK